MTALAPYFLSTPERYLRTLQYSNRVQVTRFESSEGITVTPSSATGAFDTSRFKSGTRSYRLDLTANTTGSILVALPSAIDLLGKNIAVALSIDGQPSNYNLLAFDVGDTSGLTSFRYLNIVFPMQSQRTVATGILTADTDTDQDSWAYSQWPSELETVGSYSDAQMQAVTYVRLRIRSTVSQSVWVDDIFAYDNPLHNTNGIASFRFDDGLDSHYTNVAPMLEARGLIGGFYIVPDWLDTAGFMTTAQVEDLIARGHEVGVHGETTHIEDYRGEAAISAELKRNRDAVLALGGRGDVYVYPKGHVRYPDSLNAGRKLFSVASDANVQEWSVLPPPEPMLVGGTLMSEAGVTNTGTTDNWVLRCKRGEWAVLYTHSVEVGGDVEPDSLAALLDKFQTESVTIMPLGEVVDTYMTYGYGPS